MSSVDVDYERRNDRIIVARQDGGEGMEDGSKRGGPVDGADQAEKQIDRYPG